MRKYKNLILFVLFVVGLCAMISLIGTAGALETNSITAAEAFKQSVGGALVMLACLIADTIVKRAAR